MNKEDKNFVDYVSESLRKGLSHSQIARSIGMSLTHFEKRLNYIFNEKPIETEVKVEEPKDETPVEEPKVEEVEPAPKKRTSKKTKTEQVEE